LIPKTIHFLWSGKTFPYPFYLAVLSARKIHPDWDILLHSSQEPQSPWWNRALEIAQVRRESPESWLESVPDIGPRLVDLYNRVPLDYPAGKSNMIRLAVLLREGGWYLDCDTLCIRPLSEVATTGAVVGEELVWAHDEERVTTGFRLGMLPSVAAFSASWLGARAGLSPTNPVERALRGLWSRPELNNAVLAAEPGNAWIARLLELALEQDPAVRFALGPGLVNLGWRRPGTAALPLRAPTNAFYQFPPSQTSRYFQGALKDLPAGAAVLHWCSSNHRKLVAAMTPEAVKANAGRGPWFEAASRLVD